MKKEIHKITSIKISSFVTFPHHSEIKTEGRNGVFCDVGLYSWEVDSGRMIWRHFEDIKLKHLMAKYHRVAL